MRPRIETAAGIVFDACDAYIAGMATLTIRNFDDEAHRRLRIRAAENGRSMEEEARRILQETIASREDAPAKGFGTRVHELFADLGGVELEIPPREPMRDPPTFD